MIHLLKEGDRVKSGLNLFRYERFKRVEGDLVPLPYQWFAVAIGVGRRILVLFDWDIMRAWLCLDWRREHLMYRPADMDGPTMVCRRCAKYNDEASNYCRGGFWEKGVMFKRLKKAKDWLGNRKDWKEYRKYEKDMYSEDQ